MEKQVNATLFPTVSFFYYWRLFWFMAR
jgi:hypothetical protein